MKNIFFILLACTVSSGLCAASGGGSARDSREVCTPTDEEIAQQLQAAAGFEERFTVRLAMLQSQLQDLQTLAATQAKEIRILRTQVLAISVEDLRVAKKAIEVSLAENKAYLQENTAHLQDQLNEQALDLEFLKAYVHNRLIDQEKEIEALRAQFLDLLAVQRSSGKE